MSHLGFREMYGIPFLHKKRNARFPNAKIYRPDADDRSVYLPSGVFPHLNPVCCPTDRCKNDFQNLHLRMARAPLRDLMMNDIVNSQLPGFCRRCKLPTASQEAFKVLSVDVPHWIENYSNRETPMAWQKLEYDSEITEVYFSLHRWYQQ